MSEQATNGIKRMNALAEQEILINEFRRQAKINELHSTALAENANHDLRQAIAERVVSPEVSALNDKAELEVFGSRGRTYTDPETGETIATPEKPLMGKLEEIKNNPRYGKTQAERDQVASVYQEEIKYLVDNGFELCQAKLIQDLRDTDWENVNKLAAVFMTEGMDPAEAQFKAQRKYDAIDAKRQELIKEKGAFTKEEYELARKGKDLYEPAEPAEAEPTEARRDPKEFLRELPPEFAQELATALNDYVNLLAQRERRTVHLKVGKHGKYSKEAVIEAQSKYEALRKQAKELVLNKLVESGEYSPAEIKLISVLDDGSEIAALRSAGKFETEKFVKRLRFANWWARQGGQKLLSMGNIKKTGVMAAVGLPIGVLASGIAAPLLGGAAAGLLAARVARGLTSGKVNKDADAATVGGKQYERRHKDQQEALKKYHDENKDDLYGPDTVSDAFAEGTERSVARHRKRMAKAVGVAAFFGALAEYGPNIAEEIANRFNIRLPWGNGNSDTPIPPETPDEPEPGIDGDQQEGSPSPEVEPSVEAWTDVVEPGDGLTHSIMDYASEKGEVITPARSFEVFEQLQAEGLINSDTVTGSTAMNVQGGIGYDAPGSTTWSPEVVARMNELLGLSEE